MYYYDSAYFGMHFFWWCFWLILWVTFFSLMIPVPRRHWQRLRETPKDILLRRLANGEINEQEFESRKIVIERESHQNFPPSKSGKLRPAESQGI